MNPPDNVPKFLIEVRFIRPDGTAAGRRIIGPEANEVIEEVEEDD